MTEEPKDGLDGEQSYDEIDDDFLFHLYKGGEMLRASRVVEAKDHLEKAFSLKPTNPKGQNLLALVYFKLGLFSRAIDIYTSLVESFPQDPTLRVNLAIAFFKADQLNDAEDQLRKAIELAPDHKNAHRYLGLVLVRNAEPEAARKHFIKAGVKNIDHLVSIAPMDNSDHEHQSRQKAHSRVLAEVAEEGFRELEEKEFPFRDVGPGSNQQKSSPASDREHEQQVQQESWRAMESMESSLPEGRSSVQGSDLLMDGKSLLVCSPPSVYCRLTNVVWLEGDLSFTPVNKRFGGKDTKHPFDRQERAVMRTEGKGCMRLEPPEGKSFFLLENDSESRYFLEDLVFAFADGPSWENGRLPAVGSGEDLSIFHIFGHGRIVLCIERDTIKRAMVSGQKVRLPVTKLVGWSGTFVPRLFVAEPPLPANLWIELTGEGEVLFVG